MSSHYFCIVEWSHDKYHTITISTDTSEEYLNGAYHCKDVLVLQYTGNIHKKIFIEI